MKPKNKEHINPFCECENCKAIVKSMEKQAQQELWNETFDKLDDKFNEIGFRITLTGERLLQIKNKFKLR